MHMKMDFCVGKILRKLFQDAERCDLSSYQLLSSDYQQLLECNQQLATDCRLLSSDYQQLAVSNQRLSDAYSLMCADYQQLSSNYELLSADCQQLSIELSNCTYAQEQQLSNADISCVISKLGQILECTEAISAIKDQLACSLSSCMQDENAQDSDVQNDTSYAISIAQNEFDDIHFAKANVLEDDGLKKLLIECHRLCVAMANARIEVNTFERDILETVFKDFYTAYTDYLKSQHVELVA